MLTFSPASRNTRAFFQDERVTYRPTGPDISTILRSTLNWSESSDNPTTYTHTLRDRGRIRLLTALAADDLVPPLIHIIGGAAPEVIWGFYGATLTPCVGQTTLRAIKPTPTAEAELLATIYLLQNNTEFQRPDQLTLAQALQTVLPGLAQKYRDGRVRHLLADALHIISTYFHIVVVVPDPSFQTRTYQGETRAIDCLWHLGTLLLPLAESILQPA